MPKVSFSLHCESSSLPKHCLEDIVELHTCRLGCDSWKASGGGRVVKALGFGAEGSDFKPATRD